MYAQITYHGPAVIDLDKIMRDLERHERENRERTITLPLWAYRPEDNAEVVA